MNIHPIFVHFPIALLTIYALFELARLPVLTRQSWYTGVKTALLYLGTAAGLVTLQTGDMAEQAAGHSRLVEVHSSWAAASITIFGILAGAYLLSHIETAPWYLANVSESLRKTLGLLFAIARFVLMLSPLIALIGLISITVTGALGGSIVYGPDIDPVAKLVYSILIGQ